MQKTASDACVKHVRDIFSFSDGIRLWRCDLFTWPNATFYGRSTSCCESLQESNLLGSTHCFTGSWHFSEQPVVALWIIPNGQTLKLERYQHLLTQFKWWFSPGQAAAWVVKVPNLGLMWKSWNMVRPWKSNFTLWFDDLNWSCFF